MITKILVSELACFPRVFLFLLFAQFLSVCSVWCNVFQCTSIVIRNM
jgi:hypothetical protein